jgi:hypothetical protein
MAKAPSLPKQFPDADFVVKAKFWTPKGSTVDLSGPYPEFQGACALMILSTMNPTPRQRKLMEELYRELTKKSRGRSA